MFASIVLRHHFHRMLGTVTPDTYNFGGNGVTLLGFVGVISTFIIIVTAFRRYYGSPLRK
jgi:hypothetical protein